MIRLLATLICLGLGGPVVAAPPDAATQAQRHAPRTEKVREEDPAEIWLRESAPRR